MLDNYLYTAKKDKVLKLYSWIAYDVFLTGLIGYNFVVLKIQTFAENLDSVEKFILFICTVVFAGFRIDNLRQDNRRKRLDNDEHEEDIKDRRANRKSA